MKEEKYMKKAVMILNRSVALIMAAAVLIVSCSMPGTGPGGIPESMLVSASGRVIDLYLDEIRPYVEDDLAARGILDDVDGYDVATRTLEEEHGQEYLAFTLASSDFSSVDEVLEAADGLVPEEELEAIRETLDGAETRLMTQARSFARVLTPSQEAEFYDDLSVMVIKSAVLLTAAVVYAFVPDTVLWGKVTAASAVAIAAGILAATIMAIVEHYRTDSGLDESFGSWLRNAAAEPAAYWGIASSVINIGQSLKRGPVVTGVILAIFAICGVADDAKDMLETFNFSA